MDQIVPQTPANEAPIPCVVYAATPGRPARLDPDADRRLPRDHHRRRRTRDHCGEHDEAVSAYSRNRGGGLERAWEHAECAAREHGRAELWVQHSDRLARGDGSTARHLVEHVLRGRKVGVAVRSVQDDWGGESVLLAAVMGERNFENSRRKSEAVRLRQAPPVRPRRAAGRTVLDGYVGLPVLDGGRRAALQARPAPRARHPPNVRARRRRHRGGQRRAPTQRGGSAHEGRRRLRPPACAGHALQPVLRRADRAQPQHARRSRRGPRWLAPGAPLPRRVRPRAGAHRRARSGEGLQPQAQPALLASRARRPHRLRAARVEDGRRDQRLRRRDGTQARTYTCDHVKRATGLCDAPIVNAKQVDRAVVAHVEGFFVYFDGWLRSVTDHNAAQREAGSARSTADALETAVRRSARVRHGARPPSTPAMPPPSGSRRKRSRT